MPDIIRYSEANYSNIAISKSMFREIREQGGRMRRRTRIGRIRSREMAKVANWNPGVESVRASPARTNAINSMRERDSLLDFRLDYFDRSLLALHPSSFALGNVRFETYSFVLPTSCLSLIFSLRQPLFFPSLSPVKFNFTSWIDK